MRATKTDEATEHGELLKMARYSNNALRRCNTPRSLGPCTFVLRGESGTSSDIAGTHCSDRLAAMAEDR